MGSYKRHERDPIYGTMEVYGFRFNERVGRIYAMNSQPVMRGQPCTKVPDVRGMGLKDALFTGEYAGKKCQEEEVR
jgi:hypothetical protein